MAALLSGCWYLCWVRHKEATNVALAHSCFRLRSGAQSILAKRIRGRFPPFRRSQMQILHPQTSCCGQQRRLRTTENLHPPSHRCLVGIAASPSAAHRESLARPRTSIKQRLSPQSPSRASSCGRWRQTMAAAASDAATAGDRPFDVVVWGATGFVGKLVCERLARKYQGEVRWAMAGRNEQKLRGVRDSAAAINPAAAETAIFTGDLTDAESLRKITRQAKVIIALAGPYVKLGTPVVEACLATGTHYVDLTAETWWVADLIEKYHDEAAAKGVRIVPACGYDSVPSDLGTWFAVQHVRKTLNKGVSRIRMLPVMMQGGLSGGTVDSILASSLPPAAAAVKADPYCLNPPGPRGGPDGADQSGTGRVPELGVRTFPFMMEFINTRVVRRSAALRGDYGAGFSYTEATPAPSPGWLWAPLLTGILRGIFGALTLPGVGCFLRKLLPSAGSGPDEKTREGNDWHDVFLATPEGESAASVQIEAHGRGDPGYGSTHRIVLEAGLCLALQLDECEETGFNGGILTPSTAMGQALVDRLAKHGGVTFSVADKVGMHEWPKVSEGEAVS